LFHVRDKQPVQCPDTKIWYLPLPEKEEISGGMQAAYLAFNMVAIYRPVTKPENYGIINKFSGIPYEVNETLVYVAKVKPKFSANIGIRSIFFDVDKQRY